MKRRFPNELMQNKSRESVSNEVQRLCLGTKTKGRVFTDAALDLKRHDRVLLRVSSCALKSLPTGFEAGDSPQDLRLGRPVDPVCWNGLLFFLFDCLNVSSTVCRSRTKQVYSGRSALVLLLDVLLWCWQEAGEELNWKGQTNIETHMMRLSCKSH